MTSELKRGPAFDGRTFCWLATAALLALYGSTLHRYAVDWPLHDDLTQILAIPGYLVQYDLRQQLALLLELSPEHRIATLRVAGWLGAHAPGGLDFRLLIFVGNAMLVAIGAYFVALAPATRRAASALLAAVLLTSSTHYGAQFWATGALQHFGVSFYALTALALLRGTPRNLPALAFAILASLTSANGLMVFPAAVVMLAWSRRRREALAWAIVGVVACAVYFVGYASPAGRPGLGDTLREPLQLARFVFATLGAIGDAWVVDLAIGIALSGLWLRLLVRPQGRDVPPVLVAAALFFALSCAMIAVGRANLGAEAVALSRYRVYSAGFALSTVLALAHVLPPGRARWIVSAATLASAVLYLLAWPVYSTYLVELSMNQRALRDHYAANGSGEYEGFTQEFGDFTLKRAAYLGFYRGAGKADGAVAMTGGMPDAMTFAAASHFELIEGTRAFSVYGWIDGRHSSVDVWLDGEGRAFRGQLKVVRWWRGPVHGYRTGFHGTVSMDGLPAGRYRIGVGDHGVAWSTQAMTIR